MSVIGMTFIDHGYFYLLMLAYGIFLSYFKTLLFPNDEQLAEQQEKLLSWYQLPFVYLGLLISGYVVAFIPYILK
jgi:hypothetical protein